MINEKVGAAFDVERSGVAASLMFLEIFKLLFHLHIRRDEFHPHPPAKV